MNEAKQVFRNYAWAIKWRSPNHMDGLTEALQGRHRSGLGAVPEHVAGNNLLLFTTREKARSFIREQWDYLKARPDLGREPHGWRMPQAVKVRVEVKET